MKLVKTLIGACLVVALPAQAVQPDQVGTITSVGSYACGLFPECTVLDFVFQSITNIDGAPGQHTASSQLDQPDPNGTARSMVTASGDLSIPNLLGEAYSNNDAGTTAFAMAAQAYQYDGPDDGTIEVSVNLTASIYDTFDYTVPSPDPTEGALPVPPAPDLTKIEVLAGLVATTSGFSLLDISENPILAFDDLQGYVHHSSVFLEAEDDDINDDLPTAASDMDTLSVGGLLTGAEVILYAAMLVSSDGAEDEGPLTGMMNFTDAFSTVSMSFNPGFDEVSLATVVPVPPAVWLFGSSLAGLFLLRRRAQV